MSLRTIRSVRSDFIAPRTIATAPPRELPIKLTFDTPNISRNAIVTQLTLKSIIPVAVPLAVSMAAKIECEHMVRFDELRRGVIETVGISCQPMQEKQGRFALATESLG